mmetsp:Transcript_13237/g.49095  ORF Transcript_13237/g.49095 Transcript_13237/m.49095 type:complete len:277 (+) Transcript_13237:2037-2867(+)
MLGRASLGLLLPDRQVGRLRRRLEVHAVPLGVARADVRGTLPLRVCIGHRRAFEVSLIADLEAAGGGAEIALSVFQRPFRVAWRRCYMLCRRRARAYTPLRRSPRVLALSKELPLKRHLVPKSRSLSISGSRQMQIKDASVLLVGLRLFSDRAFVLFVQAFTLVMDCLVEDVLLESAHVLCLSDEFLGLANLRSVRGLNRLGPLRLHKLLKLQLMLEKRFLKVHLRKKLVLQSLRARYDVGSRLRKVLELLPEKRVPKLTPLVDFVVRVCARERGL